MRKAAPRPRRKKAPKRVLALPDLEPSKAAVLTRHLLKPKSQTMKQVFRPFGFRTCLSCGRNAAAYSEDSPSAPGASLGGLRRSFAKSLSE